MVGPRGCMVVASTINNLKDARYGVWQYCLPCSMCYHTIL
jgi:hypothetical protein